MKCIIAGSRKLAGFDKSKYEELYIKHTAQFLEAMDLCPFINEITEVGCGEAPGVDTLGKLWAKLVDVPVKSFPADWSKYGKAAGMIRNEEMAKWAEACVVIMRHDSKGSLDMAKRAKKNGLQVFVSMIEFESVEEYLERLQNDS